MLVRLRKLEKLDKDQFTDDERADAEEVQTYSTYNTTFHKLLNDPPIIIYCYSQLYSQRQAEDVDHDEQEQ